MKKVQILTACFFCSIPFIAKTQIHPVTGISTNFGGYWATTTASNNPILPNNSHELLSFSYNGVTYSTGVNNATLTINGVTFTSGNFRAIPVAGLLGSLVGNTTSTLLAMASLKDGNPTQGVSTHPNINGKTIRDIMIDGIRGLDLGTGVTNLPTSSIMNFGIHSIKVSGIADAEPDILITQIAQPGAGSLDSYSFLDASGNLVGNAVTQTQSALLQLGEYRLDLFSLTGGPLTNATPWGGLFETANGTRPLRMSAYRLADFGITALNAAQIVTFRIVPSGSSDLAFVGYNANTVNFRPAISTDPGNSLSGVCVGGTAILKIIATPANEGVLTYRWEQSINSGTSFTPITNGVPFSGATSDELRVSNPTSGHQYRCIVTETGTVAGVPFSYESISTSFTISITSIGNPTIGTQPVNALGCAGNPFNLFAVASGGTGVYTYQWYSGASLTGPYTLINGAIDANYSGTFASPGPAFYRVIILNDGCLGSVTSNTVSVTTSSAGTVLTTTNGERCGTGIVNLTASSSNGGTFSWRDGNGLEVSTNANFSPNINATTNYFVTATLSGCTTPANTVTATINSVPSFISCSANISQNLAPGQCLETVMYAVAATGTPAPTFTYNFSGATTGSGNGTGSGFVFNKGVTNVTITATNACSTATCSFTVTNYFCLSGMVKNDPDGLTNNLIDGTGTNAGAAYVSIVSGGTITNNGNGTSTVIGGTLVATVPVIGDGTYSFAGLIAGTYRIVLHNSVGGSLTTAITAGWINTGEGIGTTSDGLVNGITPVTLTTANVANVNFGVNQIPVATSSMMPFQANVGYTIPIPASQFLGGDASGGSIQQIRITAFPTNAQAFTINGIKYFSEAEFNAAFPGGAIISANTNGNPNQSIGLQPVLGNMASSIISFVTIDNAGAESLLASVTIPYSIILPVTGLELSITKGTGCSNTVNWQTLTEINTRSFAIQVSEDGVQWQLLGNVVANGNSVSRIAYSYTHLLPAKAITYYRIQATDKNGAFTFSNTSVASNLCYTKTIVALFPNPFHELLTIKGLNGSQNLIIITDGPGRIIATKKTTGSMETINTSAFATGTYFISISALDGSKRSFKIVKN